ncbi:hypothetical protein KC19_1G010200 [Ceratodon purpureus]|uniref:Uncharacterized protein n=1 Tax=Ceratodon purpureus TaxID=3225 RepID=A0A8T0IZZ3_CERPU|nr:hypothetical protein KC19_1G010200 [Ceratodon purpureus]
MYLSWKADNAEHAPGGWLAGCWQSISLSHSLTLARSHARARQTGSSIAESMASTPQADPTAELLSESGSARADPFMRLACAWLPCPGCAV